MTPTQKKPLDKTENIVNTENSGLITIDIQTSKLKANYEMPDGFTGKIVFEFNKGGLSGVERWDMSKLKG